MHLGRGANTIFRSSHTSDLVVEIGAVNQLPRMLPLAFVLGDVHVEAALVVLVSLLEVIRRVATKSLGVDAPSSQQPV